MSTHTWLYRFLFRTRCHFIAVMLVVVLALIWSGLAFCAEIHDTARDGDLAKAQTLLKADPNVVSSRRALSLPLKTGSTVVHLQSPEVQSRASEDPGGHLHR